MLAPLAALASLAGIVEVSLQKGRLHRRLHRKCSSAAQIAYPLPTSTPVRILGELGGPARRREEAALAEELRAIRLKNQFLGADKAAVERKKWESQQTGAQRESKERQLASQMEAAQKKEVAEKQTAQRLLNLQRERAAHEEFLKKYEAHVATTALESSAVADEIAQARRVSYNAQRVQVAGASGMDELEMAVDSDIAARLRRWQTRALDEHVGAAGGDSAHSDFTPRTEALFHEHQQDQARQRVRQQLTGGG